MTTIRTVDELEALPVGAVVRLQDGSLAERKTWYDGRPGLKISGSQLGLNNEDWSMDFSSPSATFWAMMLPAEPLHPRTVTTAEWESAVVKVQSSVRSNLATAHGTGWNWLTRTEAEIAVNAALAAMGIEVSND